MPPGFDFSERASLSAFPEKMDQPCSYEDLRRCLHDIASVNRLTFAYRPTLEWLGEIVPSVLRTPIHILDVGCGYGDSLRRIERWAGKRKLAVILTGIDLNPDAIRVARVVTPPSSVITYTTGNAYTWQPPVPIDLVVSSLLTHHLEDAELIDFLRWMESTARLGWFINDLHRQPVPYYLFRLLTYFTNWHPFPKHDGPVSILRSFRPADWHRLCAAAGISTSSYELRERTPARLCVSRNQEITRSS